MKIGNSERESIFEIIRKCGEIMLSVRDIEEDGDNISDKEGQANFVTVFDLKVQKTLISSLSALFPQAYFFAEEKDNSPEKLKEGLCFIIDPIDGTTNFIHELHCSAISVGLYDKGQPLFGAVYDPYMDEMFWAVRDEGAYLNDRKITVSRRELSKALVTFGSSPYNRRELAAAFFRKLENVFMACADIRRSGSAALDICNVAAGRSDVYFEEVVSPWDYAAGWIILKEAGGRVTSFDGSEIPPGTKTSILCANPELHQKMLKLLSL